MTRQRTLVVGGYGYGNVGDEAILAGLLARLGTDGVTVLSRDPAATASLHGVRAVGPRDALRALRDSTTLLVGGGGLFGRDMGRIGRLLPAVGLAARAVGRRVVIEGVDIDEDLSPTARRLLPPLLRRADRVTVRDQRSAELARGFGVEAIVVPDLSDAMPAATPAAGRRLLQSAGVDLRRPVVGLALAGLRPELWERTRSAVAEAMDALPDVEFCFIPMSRHPSVPTHDDLRAAIELRELQPRLHVVEAVGHPAEVLAANGHFSAVVAMRYHAMLFADRADVPLVPIPYAEKTMRWLADHGRVPVEPSAHAILAALHASLDARLEPIRAAS